MTDQSPTTVDSGNLDQLRSWDGDEGAYWSAHADAFDAAVRDYHPLLMRAAAIGADDRILDVGCGAGQTTIDAARATVTGRALGVDLSGPLLRVARTRAVAGGVANAEFVHADAQSHDFGEACFDLVISRTGVMFFADAAAAFANLARATRPGGRLALLVWQRPERNEWFLTFATTLAAGRPLPAPRTGAPGPFSLGDPDHVRRLLERAGWSGIDVEDLALPMFFGADADAATTFVSGLLAWMLADLPPERRSALLGDLAVAMRAHETADGVAYRSAAWLITARRS